MRPECQQCQEWMEDAFGEELEAGRPSAFDAHLAGCEECRASLEEYRLLRRGLDWLEKSEDGPRPFVEAKILRAAAERNAEKAAKPSAFWRWMLRPATIGFATLALIAGLGYLGREELRQHRRAEDFRAPAAPVPVAPTEPNLSKDQVPQDKASPPPVLSAPGGGSTDVKLDAVKSGPAALPAGELRREAKTPAPTQSTAPATRPDTRSQGIGAEAKKEKSRSQPELQEGEAAPQEEALGRGAAIPEAEVAPPPVAPAPKPTTEMSSERKKSAESPIMTSPPAKTLQKRAPQPEAASSAPAQEAGVADTAEEKVLEDARYEKLLSSGKEKIRRQSFSAALEDFLAAQKLRDTKEIQDLIALCRSHLRGDG